MNTRTNYDKGGGLFTSLLATGGLLLAMAGTPVLAADFTVNDLSDAVDLAPGDGTCEVTAATGDCTLRAAVMETNALAGADTITLPAGTFELTITGVDESWTCAEPCVLDSWSTVVTSDASIGDLDINDDVTITGAGIDQTIIQWAAIAADEDPDTGDRIFHVAVPAGATANIASVVIQDLAVVNGQAGLIPTEAADVCVGDEGVQVYTPANLNDYDIYDYNAVDADCNNQTIKIVQFRRMGGAIALGGGYAIVTYEQAVHGPDSGGDGGGGADMGPFPGGKPGEEEGFSIESVSLNRVAMLSSWAGADGGGIYSAAPAQFNQVAISGNFSGTNGGGIYNDAALTISGSLIGKLFDADSLASYPELGTGNQGENGGGMFDTGSHTTSIVGSAINGNSAIGGGGIAARALITVNIDNSTISGNTGTDVGGGITTNGTVNLRNVTVANNEATTDAPGGGGGLNAFGPGTYTFNNTVLSNNLVSGRVVPLANCGCSGGGACDPGVMVSGFYNIEDGDTCSLSIASGTDLPNTDPGLADLADNGGLTETHALASGSPAVDQGFQVLCNAMAAEAWGAFDQRGSGFGRTRDGNDDGVSTCDRGAFELAASSSGGSSGGGGGCAINPNASFDPLWAILVLFGLGYLVFKLRAKAR